MITVKDLVRAATEKRLLVASIVLVFLLASIGWLLVASQSYTATTTLYVSPQTGDSPTAAYQGTLLSQQRVKSYAEIATNPRVVSGALRESGINESVEDLARRTTVTSNADSVLLDLSVSDRSPEVARSLANAMAQSLLQVITDLEKPSLPGAAAPVVIRIVQAATVPANSDSPGAIVVVVTFAVAGLLLGLGVAAALHVYADRIDSSAGLTEATNTRVLSSIPLVGALPSIQDKHFVADADLLDSLRALRANLVCRANSRESYCVVVTSTLSGEGKSLTAAGLASVLALGGSSVALVDADLRRPRVAEFFGTEKSVGLTSVAASQLPLSDALQDAGIPGLSILAAGRTPPNPSELLGSDAVRRIIEECRSRFDYVVIDSPPLLAVTDASVISPIADGVLFVCRSGYVKRSSVRLAVSAIENVEGKIVGTVLNAANRSREGRLGGAVRVTRPRGILYSEDATTSQFGLASTTATKRGHE